MTSPWDRRPRKIKKKLSCATPNLIYYLKCTQCPGPGIPHYTGSTVNFKQRWSKHKCDMTKLVGKDCHFCEQVDDPGSYEDGYPLLRKVEDKWMVDMGSLGRLDPVQGCNKKDDAAAKAWGT